MMKLDRVIMNINLDILSITSLWLMQSGRERLILFFKKTESNIKSVAFHPTTIMLHIVLFL